MQTLLLLISLCTTCKNGRQVCNHVPKLPGNETNTSWPPTGASLVPRPHGVGGEGPQATWGGRGGAAQHGIVYLLLYNETVTRVKRTEVRILLASLQEIVGHGW